MFRNKKSVRIRGAWPLLGSDFDPMALDEGVRSLVVDLNAAGYETLASCQGGPGHMNTYPGVTFSRPQEWMAPPFLQRAEALDLHVFFTEPREEAPFSLMDIAPELPWDGRDCEWFCARMRVLFGLGP